MDVTLDETTECLPQEVADASPVPEDAVVSQVHGLKRTRWDRILDFFAVLIWGIVAAAVLTAILNGGTPLDIGKLVFYALLTYLFLRRRPAARKGTPWETLLAWGGAILPMGGLAMATGGWSALGLLVQGIALLTMILALLSLGRSFGIAPADRGLVRKGSFLATPAMPTKYAGVWYLWYGSQARQAGWPVGVVNG